MSSSRVLLICKRTAVPNTFTRSTGTLSPTAPLPLEAVEQEFRDKYYPR